MSAGDSGQELSEELQQLQALLSDLLTFAQKRHSIQQGLLAAVMVADALKAGGCESLRLKLGVTKLHICKADAPEALLENWNTIVGDCENVDMPHNLLVIDDFYVDPIVAKVHKDHEGVFYQSLPDCYGPLTTTAIYNK